MIKFTLNGNSVMQISESLQYRISTKFLQGFMGYLEKSIYVLM
jgi:hypothetical protein